MSGLRVCMLLHKSVVHDSRVRREAATLAKAGHDVTVVELDRKARGRLDGFSRASAAPYPWVRRMLPFHAYRAAFLATFVARVVALRPDVVHAHDAAMLLAGLIGARLTGALLVYDSHELATGVPYRSGGWERFVGAIERVAVPRCAAVITVSEGIADRVQERYGLARRPAVVRNVCALPVSPPTGELRARLGIGDAPLVLHQGAVAPDRGCEVLIRAMAEVPDAHLVFLGDEGEPGFTTRLREIADGRVHFHPGVPVERLLALTAEADVGVSLLQDMCENHRLALPNKVFEYLAAGVPVVVSDLPEMRRLVEAHGVGSIAAPSRPTAVASALRTAMNGAAAARVPAAARELSWARERHRLEQVYAALERPRRALVLVRNTATHDARVRREVDALAHAGWEPVVVATVSTAVPERRGEVAGAPLIRLAPRSPFRRVRDRLPSRPPAPGSQAPSRGGVARRAHRVLTALDFYRQGIGAVRALRPRLVHCNDWNTMWIGVVARRLLGARVVYDAHELWPDRNGRAEPRGWLLAAEALFVRAADEVITTSPGYAELMARRYRIAEPVLVRNVSPAGAAAPQHVEGSSIVYVGGLLRGRGLEQAIEALPQIPGARLKLLGPGAPIYVDELRALARAHGVDDRLELCAPVPPQEVVAAVAGAAIGLCLIQPVCRSYELTLPNKLFEYAAAGVPVLASDLPVIADTVRRWDAGELVPPSDPAAIATGARRLLAGDRRATARRGALALAGSARWESERERLAEVYARAARTP
ncbi:MAG: glycosyltransferase [Solirubrobacteraceae bacterium]